MTYALISVGSLLVGIVLGMLFRKRELEAYKQGAADMKGGACWIRQQLPSHAEE